MGDSREILVNFYGIFTCLNSTREKKKEKKRGLSAWLGRDGGDAWLIAGWGKACGAVWKVYSKTPACMGPHQKEPTLAAASHHNFCPCLWTSLARHGWPAGRRSCRSTGFGMWGELLPCDADARHRCSSDKNGVAKPVSYIIRRIWGVCCSQGC